MIIKNFIAFSILCTSFELFAPSFKPASKATEDLYDAIENNDDRRILKAIEAGADLHVKGYGNTRPLHWVARHPDARYAPSIARASIERGSDIEELSDDSFTPLQLAARHFALDLVELLIKNQANVNARNGSRNRTPLEWVIYSNEPYRYGKEKIIEILIRAGAQIPDNLKQDLLIQQALAHIDREQRQALAIWSKLTNREGKPGHNPVREQIAHLLYQQQ